MEMKHCECGERIYRRFNYCPRCGKSFNVAKEIQITEETDKSDLEIRLSVWAALEKANIQTVKDICEKSPLELLSLKNIGGKRLFELAEYLKSHGFILKNADTEFKALTALKVWNYTDLL